MLPCCVHGAGCAGGPFGPCCVCQGAEHQLLERIDRLESLLAEQDKFRQFVIAVVYRLDRGGPIPAHDGDTGLHAIGRRLLGWTPPGPLISAKPTERPTRVR